jgi:hypothetical protein
MYSDQLRLLAQAEENHFLAASELSSLERSIVTWNSRQLSDHLCAFHLAETTHISTAIASAFPVAASHVLQVAINVVKDVTRRAANKLTS